jgi:voltage-gated potassium channel
MTDIQLMVLRRLRLPLIVLIVAYAVSVFGLTLMPGVDPDGNPWRMSLFDAFYVMSYTATTIGFGEVPYPFSYAQRMWMTVSIYVSVIGWAYALGSIFALVRYPAFRQALARSRFESGVRRLVDRFYVICGYGQSGRRLAAALDRLGFASVVLDISDERLQPLFLQDTAQPTIGLVGDARLPELLDAAGIRRPNCQGLTILTADDDVAQTIAIEGRVMAPDLPVLARVKTRAAQETLAAFGGVTVVNPFETFAFNFGLALAKPDALRLEDWLTGVPGAEPPPRIEVPRGRWVLAGYGRFGRAIAAQLTEAGLPWKSIDRDPANCDVDCLEGTGLAAEALQRAGIEEACGLVAGTDNDANNLAIVIAARRLRPRLFVVIRQNHAANRSLIEAARANMSFVQAELMTHECVQMLTTPLLNRFLLRARAESNTWAQGVCGRVNDLIGAQVPHTWSVTCDPVQLGMRRALIERPEPRLTIAHLLTDPDDRRVRLKGTALLLLHNGRDQLLPDEGTPLSAGDRVLFAGEQGAERVQERLLGDDVAIDYVRTGSEPPRTWVGRWLARAG